MECHNTLNQTDVTEISLRPPEIAQLYLNIPVYLY